MTKALETYLNLHPIEEEVINSIEETSHVIEVQMTTADKIDFALTNITGLDEHDKEMDDIAQKALSAYKDILSLGMNCTELNAGRILDTANNMLKTALEAKDAKVNRKLKMIDLMLKKHKLDKSKNGVDNDNDEMVPANMFDRNELLKMLKENIVDVKPSKNDK